jgi:hypothetical protein
MDKISPLIIFQQRIDRQKFKNDYPEAHMVYSPSYYEQLQLASEDPDFVIIFDHFSTIYKGESKDDISIAAFMRRSREQEFGPPDDAEAESAVLAAAADVAPAETDNDYTDDMYGFKRLFDQAET